MVGAVAVGERTIHLFRGAISLTVTQMLELELMYPPSFARIQFLTNFFLFCSNNSVRTYDTKYRHRGKFNSWFVVTKLGEHAQASSECNNLPVCW